MLVFRLYFVNGRVSLFVSWTEYSTRYRTRSVLNRNGKWKRLMIAFKKLSSEQFPKQYDNGTVSFLCPLCVYDTAATKAIKSRRTRRQSNRRESANRKRTRVTVHGKRELIHLHTSNIMHYAVRLFGGLFGVRCSEIDSVSYAYTLYVYISLYNVDSKGFVMDLEHLSIKKARFNVSPHH